MKVLDSLKSNYKRIFNVLTFIVCVFLLLAFSGSPLYTNSSYRHYLNYILVFATVTLSVLFVLKIKIDNGSTLRNNVFSTLKRILLSRKTLAYLAFVLIYSLSFFFNDVLNESSVNNFFVSICIISCAYFFSNIISFEKIKQYYRIIFPLICIVSLLFYSFLFFNSYTPYFLSFKSDANQGYNNFFFIYFQIQKSTSRNCSFFWEPALFAIFINIGFIIEFIKLEKKSIPRLIIYFVTLLTTFSISGFATFALILIYFIFSRTKGKKPLLYLTCLLGLFAFFGALLFFVPVLRNKLTNGTTSLYTRVYGPIISFDIFKTGNIFGVGVTNEKAFFDALVIAKNLSSKIDCQSSSLSFYVISFGVFGILLYILPAFFLIKNNHDDKFIFIYFYVFFTVSEPLQDNLFFLMLIFYFLDGFASDSKNCQKSESNISIWELLKRTFSKKNENNSLLLKNSAMSFFVKGFALIVGLFTTNGYLKYFNNSQPILGIWFVLLQTIVFLLTFDLGIGNGLKNRLIASLENNDTEKSKVLINSAFVSGSFLCLLFIVIGIVFCQLIDFNSFFGVSCDLVSPLYLNMSIFIMIVAISLQFVLKIVGNIFESLQIQSASSIFSLFTTLSLFLYVNLFNVNNGGIALLLLSIVYLIVSNLPYLIGGIFLFKKKIPFIKISLKSVTVQSCKEITNLGIKFLILQLSMLVIHNLNSVIITSLYTSETVPDYYLYEKIFNIVITISTLLSGPIWSIIVKAKESGDIIWINKLAKTIRIITLGLVIFDLIFVVSLPLLFKLVFGYYDVSVDYLYALIFASFSILMVVTRFESSISNGLENLRPQIIAATIGVIIKVGLTILQFILYSGDSNSSYWYLVQASSCISMIPFVLIMPISNRISLKKISKGENI